MKSRAVVCLGALVFGCARPPPPSAFPTPRAAIDAMRATYACSRGLQGESKVDYFGDQGRVRGSTLFLVSRPERVRLDVFSPFGVTLSTFTATEQRFSLLDLQNKVFVQGPANACNIRRFLTVPVPPHALTELFTGQAPVLQHRPEDATIRWDSGSFLIRIVSKHDAREEIRLEPHPSDWNKPWSEQRVRVLEVVVTQRGTDLYRVELAGHEAASTARAYSDPDGIDPDVLPSGPECTAEVPQRLRFVSPVAGHDVIFDHKEVVHNPPLRGHVFEVQAPRGVNKRTSQCAD